MYSPFGATSTRCLPLSSLVTLFCGFSVCYVSFPFPLEDQIDEQRKYATLFAAALLSVVQIEQGTNELWGKSYRILPIVRRRHDLNSSVGFLAVCDLVSSLYWPGYNPSQKRDKASILARGPT